MSVLPIAARRTVHADADDIRAKLAGSAVMPDERLRA
jgi:hypothetical protein